MNNFLTAQFIIAKDNLNYFFMRMLANILKFLFKISICLIINSFINVLAINIMLILYIIYTIYNMVKNIIYYINIINDLRTNLEIKDLSFEIDMRQLKNFLFERRIYYGR